MPPDPMEGPGIGNGNFDPNQTGFWFVGQWIPGPGDPQIGTGGGLGGLTPTHTVLLDLLNDYPGAGIPDINHPGPGHIDRLGDQDNLGWLIDGANRWRKLWKLHFI